MTQIDLPMEVPIKVLPRPNRNDEAVLRAVAKKLAPKVLAWLQDKTVKLEEVERDIIKACKYDEDGYEVAERLKRHSGYSPDAELVSILEDIMIIKYNILKDLCGKWVIHMKLEGPKAGAKVKWIKNAHPECKGKIGTVVHNMTDGKSAVAHESVNGNYHVNWEDMEIIVA